MKDYNKDYLKYFLDFILHGIGYAFLIAYSCFFLLFTFSFMQGRIIYIYEFNPVIYTTEFMGAIYAMVFVIIKFIEKMRKRP